MSVSDRIPNCTLCGNEMVRLKRLTTHKDIPVYACNSGEGRKGPCDGDVARLGSRF